MVILVVPRFVRQSAHQVRTKSGWISRSACLTILGVLRRGRTEFHLCRILYRPRTIPTISAASAAAKRSLMMLMSHHVPATTQARNASANKMSVPLGLGFMGFKMRKAALGG
jgi:hypothetical protein